MEESRKDPVTHAMEEAMEMLDAQPRNVSRNSRRTARAQQQKPLLLVQTQRLANLIKRIRFQFAGAVVPNLLVSSPNSYSSLSMECSSASSIKEFPGAPRGLRQLVVTGEEFLRYVDHGGRRRGSNLVILRSGHSEPPIPHA